jgi:hypothetical protein
MYTMEVIMVNDKEAFNPILIATHNTVRTRLFTVCELSLPDERELKSDDEQRRSDVSLTARPHLWLLFPMKLCPNLFLLLLLTQ